MELAKQLKCSRDTLNTWARSNTWPLYALQGMGVKVYWGDALITPKHSIRHTLATSYDVGLHELALHCGACRTSFVRWDKDNKWPLWLLEEQGFTFEWGSE